MGNPCCPFTSDPVETWRAVPFAALFLWPRCNRSRPRSTGGEGRRGKRLAVSAFLTLPALRKTILILVLVETIWALQLFDTLYILTQGGPGLKTTVLTYLVFTQAFESLKLGYASAIGLLLFLCILLSAGVIFWLIVREQRKRQRPRTAGLCARDRVPRCGKDVGAGVVGELSLLAGHKVRRRGHS